MSLVLQSAGVLVGAQALKAGMLVGLQIGLGAADIKPDFATSLVALQPATFSGYPGLLVLGAWTGPTLFGFRAILNASPVNYAHNGGPIGQRIFTYYILSGAGDLLWCERLTNGPYSMSDLGDVLTVSPQFTYRSQY